MVLAKASVSTSVLNELQTIHRAYQEKNLNGIDSKRIGHVFAQLAVEILETTMGELIRISNTETGGGVNQDNVKVLEQVKSALLKYIPMAADAIDVKKMEVVVSYVLDHIEADHLKIWWEIPQKFTAQAEKVIFSFEASQKNELIETVVTIIDQLVQQLLVHPKELLKFNFLLDKTLSGVIVVTTKLAYGQLRKGIGRLETDRLHRVAEMMQGIYVR